MENILGSKANEWKHTTMTPFETRPKSVPKGGPHSVLSPLQYLFFIHHSFHKIVIDYHIWHFDITTKEFWDWNNFHIALTFNGNHIHPPIVDNLSVP
jgi:hypothetical protein